jgi:hypothetical protein
MKLVNTLSVVLVSLMLMTTYSVNASPCPKDKWAKMSKKSSKRMASQEKILRKKFKKQVAEVAKLEKLSGKQSRMLAVKVLSSEAVKKANKTKSDYLMNEHLKFIMSKPSCKAIKIEDQKLESLLNDEWQVAFSLLNSGEVVRELLSK